MISSLRISPSTAGATFWRTVVHNAFDRTRPISGNGDGTGVAGTKSGVSTASNKPITEIGYSTPGRVFRCGGLKLRRMPRDRFFIEGVHAVGERVSLAADDARKLVTVLRRDDGDRVVLVDSGGTAFAAILEIDGKAVHARLADAMERAERESTLRTVVAQALPKAQKMDYIVEKATELGVAGIVPLRSDRVIGERTGDRKHERWQRIAKTAAQQCGRTHVPDVGPIVGWSELLPIFPAFERVYIAWELADPLPLRERFEPELRAASSALIIIGPEGGFSAAEVEAAVAAGAVSLSLGRRILRTETAALVVLAALLYARGEL